MGDDDDAQLAEGVYDDELVDDDFERAPDDAPEDVLVKEPGRRGAAHPEVAHEHAPARKQRGRVLTFLRHCADELRRVQWPDRRQVGSGHRGRPRLRRHRRRLPGPAGRALEARSSTPSSSSRDHKESMFRWYVINTYSGHENKVKQNLEHRVSSLDQTRAVRQVVVPTETVQEMKDNQKISVEKRTMPGYVLVNMDLNEDSWQVVKGTPGRHRLRRRLQRADPADPGRGRPAAAPRGRGPRAEPRPVLDRRVGQGHLRPALGLLGRDLRDQRGRGQAQGAGIHLRPRDPGRGRLRPGEEDLDMAKKVLTTIKLQAPGGQASPAPPVGPALGQHGINIMEFVKAFNAQTSERHGHHDPRRDHGLRGPLVHVRHQDAAGRGADPPGDRHREGLRRAEPHQGRHDHRRAGARRSPRRSSPT